MGPPRSSKKRLQRYQRAWECQRNFGLLTDSHFIVRMFADDFASLADSVTRVLLSSSRQQAHDYRNDNQRCDRNYDI